MGWASPTPKILPSPSICATRCKPSCDRNADRNGSHAAVKRQCSTDSACGTGLSGNGRAASAYPRFSALTVAEPAARALSEARSCALVYLA
jgi:hypothetical protein